MFLVFYFDMIILPVFTSFSYLILGSFLLQILNLFLRNVSLCWYKGEIVYVCGEVLKKDDNIGLLPGSWICCFCLLILRGWEGALSLPHRHTSGTFCLKRNIAFMPVMPLTAFVFFFKMF